MKYYRIALITALLLILTLTGCTSGDAEAIGRVKILVDADSHTVINVATPVYDTDAATKGYVDDAITAAAIPAEGTYWDDMRAPVNLGRLGGVNDPTWTSNAGGQTLLFPMNVMKEVYFVMQLPHSYIEGTDIVPHVHWCYAANLVGGSVRWGLEYQWLNDGDNAGALATIYTLTPPANNDALDLHMTNFPAINGTGHEISSILTCRVFRDAADVSDNYSNNAYLFEFDIHYETDGRGSESEGSK